MGKVDGIWVRYKVGSDAKKVIEEFKKNGVPWNDIVNENLVSAQLKYGDIYVFYSRGKSGKYDVPRIKFKINACGEVDSVDGILEGYHVEPILLDTLEEITMSLAHDKLLDDRLHDEKLLSIIDEKDKSQIPLTKEELVFLYEIDRTIHEFGYRENSRIIEIKQRRDCKQDIATIYGCEKENVATSISDFDTGKILIFFGDLNYEGNELPATFNTLRGVIGAAYFPNLLSAINLSSLEWTKDYLYIDKVVKSDGLDNLNYVGGSLYADSLVEALHLSNLEYIGGRAGFKSLVMSTGLGKLRYIGGGATFPNLISASDMGNLESIGYDRIGQDTFLREKAMFHKLTKADGLGKLKAIYIPSEFLSLKDARAFGSALEELWDNAYFPSLESKEGLENVKLVDPYSAYKNEPLIDFLNRKEQSKTYRIK